MRQLSALVLGAVMSASVAAQEIKTQQTLPDDVFLATHPLNYQLSSSLDEPVAQEQTLSYQPSNVLGRCFREQAYCSGFKEQQRDNSLNLSFRTNNLLLGFVETSYDPHNHRLKVRGKRCFGERTCLSIEKQKVSSNPAGRMRSSINEQLDKSSWMFLGEYRF